MDFADRNRLPRPSRPESMASPLPPKFRRRDFQIFFRLVIIIFCRIPHVQTSHWPVLVEVLERLWWTVPVVWRTRTIPWRAVSSKSPLPTCRMTRTMPSVRSSSAWTKSRERTAWPTSTVWISRPTSCDPLCASGSRWLKPTSLWRRPMTIFSVCSPSPSRRDAPTKSRRLHMLARPKSALFARRWPRSCSARPLAALSLSLLPSWSPKSSVVRLRRLPREFTPCRTFVPLDPRILSNDCDPSNTLLGPHSQGQAS